MLITFIVFNLVFWNDLITRKHKVFCNDSNSQIDLFESKMDEDLDQETKKKKSFTSSFEPHAFTINVYTFTSITSPLDCNGTVKNKNTKETVMICEHIRYCKKCGNFTVRNLNPDTEYSFKITGNKTGVSIKNTVKTEPFYDTFKFSIVPHIHSIDVEIVTNITYSLICSGSVTLVTSNTIIFHCTNHPKCKVCESFSVVNSVFPNTEYKFDISGEFSHASHPTFPINGTVRTKSSDDYFKVSFRPNVISIDVLIDTNISIPMFCRGSVKPMGTDKEIYNCIANNDCKMCKSFTVQNLTPFTYYNFSIHGNISKVFIKDTIKTKPLYALFEVSYKSHLSSIDVIIITNITLPMTCTGYVKSQKDNSSVFDCSSDNECKKCKSFTVSKLNPNTEYVFSIDGNFKMVKIKGTIKTEKLYGFFHVSFLKHENSIQIVTETNITLPLTCEGFVKPKYNNTAVFDCSKDNTCKNCKNFTVQKLTSNTYYEFSINGNFPQVYIKGTVKTKPTYGKYNIAIIIGVGVGGVIGCIFLVFQIIIIKKNKHKVIQTSYDIQ